MIDKLQEVLIKLPSMLENPSLWDSLIVNRRKPFTYRVFSKVDNLRVCLHKFDPCHTHEAFPHPHPWSAAFIILKGSYKMWLGHSHDLQSKPKNVCTVIMSQYSSYEITEPQTWHSVIPLEETWTVMVNDIPWETGIVHENAPTTKGKDLDKLSSEDLINHLNQFKILVENYHDQKRTTN